MKSAVNQKPYQSAMSRRATAALKRVHITLLQRELTQRVSSLSGTKAREIDRVLAYTPQLDR